jgi:hypothetical protein
MRAHITYIKHGCEMVTSARKKNISGKGVRMLGEGL